VIELRKVQQISKKANMVSFWPLAIAKTYSARWGAERDKRRNSIFCPFLLFENQRFMTFIDSLFETSALQI
jgi:hypothetical protein